MAKRVAIIIVNWNGWKDTLDCLESLKAVTYPGFSVYVVDNGSTDESVERLQRFQVSGFRFQMIDSKTNLGFAGGNNLGIKKALQDSAEYVVLLNNDTLVPPEFLKALVEAAESDPRIGIVGPKIYFTDVLPISNSRELEIGSREVSHNPEIWNLKPGTLNARIWFGGGKLNWLKIRGFHLEYDKIDALKPETYNQKPTDCDYITGCCMLVKREVIERIGFLSDDYFLYYEDVDWCLRARNAGYRVMYVPGAYIWHKVSRSSKEGSSSYVYYHVRNGYMLAWRYGSLRTRMALLAHFKWTAAKQMVKLCLPSKRAWAKATLWGMKDFIFCVHGKQPD